MSAGGSSVPAGPSPLDRGRLRARLAGQATVGTFVGAAAPTPAEACAAAGVDWLVQDLEHGVAIGSDTTLLAAAIAAELGRARPTTPAAREGHP